MEEVHNFLIDFMENQVPFNKHLKLKIKSLEPGKCEILVPWQDHLTGHPAIPSVHGGILSAIMDIAGGVACWSLIDNIDDKMSTVDLRSDYLRPGPTKDMICFAKNLRMGNRVSSAQMKIFSDGDNYETDTPIATGQAVYNIKRTSSIKTPE